MQHVQEANGSMRYAGAPAPWTLFPPLRWRRGRPHQQAWPALPAPWPPGRLPASPSPTSAPRQTQPAHAWPAQPLRTLQHMESNTVTCGAATIDAETAVLHS